jgi:hypothetical protein
MFQFGYDSLDRAILNFLIDDYYDYHRYDLIQGLTFFHSTHLCHKRSTYDRECEIE